MTELRSCATESPDTKMIHKEVLEVLSEAKVLARKFYRLAYWKNTSQ